MVTQAEAACLAVEEEHPELGKVTEFERATAAAFLFFQQAQADVVVLETGLGEGWMPRMWCIPSSL